MHAFRTSLETNSRIEEEKDDSFWEGAKSGTMERKTRRTTPQHLLSRIRIAWVRKRRRGSRIVEDVRQNSRIVGCVGVGLLEGL